MSEEQEKGDAEKATEEAAGVQGDGVTADGEFKLTVRKLEMPVRPRGVLAE
jgi:hypothetical protein